MLRFAAWRNCYHYCPDGEIGKRCGLRSRWSTILESSSLSSGTVKGETLFIRVSPFCLGMHLRR